jgi:cyclin T
MNTLGFDFDIELPYKYLEHFNEYPGINEKILFKIANNFVNDSFRTHVCLYYDPRVIALACLELS